MQFWPPFLSRRKESATASAVIGTGAGRAVWSKRDIETFLAEGYAQNADTYACITLIAATAAGVKWAVQGRDGKRLEQHPMLQLVNNPNPWQTRTELIEELVTWLLTAGEFFIEGAGPERGAPRELYPLAPHRMGVIPGTAAERIAGYEFKIGNKGAKFEPHQIAHTKLFNPLNPWRGLSPMTAAARRIDMLNEAEDWNVSLLQNGAQLSGLLMAPDGLDEIQWSRLKEMFGREHVGKGKRGKVGIGDGVADFKPIGMTPVDISWVEGQKLSTRKVCAVFGVGPELIGDGENKTYSNYQEARKALYQETVLPILDRIADALNGWLSEWFGGAQLVYVADDIEALQEDRDKLIERLCKLVDKRIITPTTAALELGYDPPPGGDLILVPAMLMPIDATGSVEPPAEPAAKALHLATEEAKAAHWKSTEAGRERMQAVAAKIVKARFDDEREAIVQAVAKSKGEASAAVAASVALDAGRKAWKESLETLYVTVGKPFAEAIEEQFKTAVGPTSTKAGGEGWAKGVRAWIAKQAGRKIKQINKTTLAQVRTELAAGAEAGEGALALSKRIDALYLKQIIPNRSETIARTETTTASNVASREAAKDTGLDMEKEWIASRDDRVRASHADVDGMSVPIDEPYDVDGEELMFPGDSENGSVENIANCRCVEGYNVKR